MTDTSTRSHRGRRVPRKHLPIARFLPLGLLVVGASAQAVIVLHLTRDSWFGLDAVNYLTTRGAVASHDLGLFRPYGGHWSTVPVLVYRLLFAVFGLSSYTPYVVVVLAVHLAIVFALYALQRAVAVRPWPAATVGWMVLFFGPGAEAFMWDATMNQTIPVLLSLVACLLLERRFFAPSAVAAASALVLVGVMCSGTGITAGVVAVGFALVRHGLRSALGVLAPAVVAFGVWFAAIGHTGGRLRVSRGDLPDLPGFLWTGLTGAAGDGVGLPQVGGVVLCVALLGPLLLRGVPTALRQLAVVGAGGALVQLVLVGLADAGIGSGAARDGRYEYVALVLLAPTVAVLVQGLLDAVDLSPLGRWGSPLLVAVVVVGLAGTSLLHGLTGERQQGTIGSASADIYRTWVYGSIMAADAGERQLSFHDSFAGAPFELFASPELRHRLPPGPHSPGTRIEAEARWFVDVATRNHELFLPTRISLHGLYGKGFRQPGCTQLTTREDEPVSVDVRTRGGTEIGVTSNSTAVTTTLFRHYSPSGTRAWTLDPGQVYVATTAKHAILRVGLNGTGLVTICHK